MIKAKEAQNDESVRKKGDHFSKSTIKEIVKAVERGAKLSELIKRYGMAKTTLSDWVREDGSQEYQASQRPLNPIERRSLFRSVLEGKMTLHEAKLAYQLRSTIVADSSLTTVSHHQ